MIDLGSAVELLDWKRRVFDIYAGIRSSDDPAAAWTTWRDRKDELYRTHPQSPIPAEQRPDFQGLDLYDYDPAFRAIAHVETIEPESYDVPTSGDETFTFARVGLATFDLGGDTHQLEIYWLTSYGGGLFLPFRDETSGKETYGAGRYLLDTVKGADLGMDGDGLVLDFNFSFNPSCSYDPKWVCPLAPPANRLALEVRAGETHASTP